MQPTAVGADLGSDPVGDAKSDGDGGRRVLGREEDGTLIAHGDETTRTVGNAAQLEVVLTSQAFGPDLPIR